MNPLPTALLCGPGFIGSQLLHLLAVTEMDKKRFSYITVILCDQTEADQLQKWAKDSSLDIRTLIGDFSDVKLLEKEAEKHNVIFDTGNAFNEVGALALAEGIAKGHSNSIYIRLTGTGVIGDSSNGDSSDAKPLSDAFQDDIEEILRKQQQDGNEHPMAKIDSKVEKMLNLLREIDRF